MKKIIKNSLFIVNVFIALLLLVSALSVYINPNIVSFLALVGIAFPVLLSLVVLLLTYWLFRLKKKFIYFNIAVVVISLPFITDFMQFSFNTAKPTSKTIKVMSFNVRQFDYYKWTENIERRDKYFEYIKTVKPDIVCFQEYFSYPKEKLENTKLLKTEILNIKNLHIKQTHEAPSDRMFGIATFSKYPIINKGVIEFENTANVCIYTDLLINKDTVRVYNNHLQSLKFLPVDYQFMDSLKLEIDSVKVTEATGIVKKLLVGYQVRANQVDVISEHIKNCKYKTIVCGDFNDTPISYAYHSMLGNLNDAFVEKGNGIGGTYNGTFPSYRIDYIFYDDNFVCEKYSSPKVDLSDHFPVITYLTKK